MKNKQCKCDLDIAVSDASNFTPVSYKFNKGEVISSRLVAASCSIPGLFPPMYYDSRLCVDSGPVQEFNHSSLRNSLASEKFNFHILCSCHPWVLHSENVSPYHDEFKSFASKLFRMMSDDNIRHHYQNLKTVLNISTFTDGRSMVCFRRTADGIEHICTLTPENIGNGVPPEANLFMLMIAPTENEYAGFTDATLLDPPDVRRPVIGKMLERARYAVSDSLQLIAACNLGVDLKY